jgi:hypothetical protein
MSWTANQSGHDFFPYPILMMDQPPAPSDDFDDICAPFAIDRATQLGEHF